MEGVKSMFSILDRLLRCINLINFDIKYFDSEDVKDLNLIYMKPLYKKDFLIIYLIILMYFTEKII